MQNKKYLEQSGKTRKVIKRVAAVALIANLLLSAVKFVFGIAFSNVAVISDAVHTLADAGITLLVLLSAIVSKPQGDKSHNYGHEKQESLLALFFSLILGGVGVWLFVDGVIGFLDPQDIVMDMRAYLLIAVMGVSVLVKEAMYWYTIRYAKIIKSEILKADAWHHRADSLASVAVVAGLGSGILFEKDWIENAAVILVAVLIIVVAVKILKNSINKLTDKAADEKTRTGLLKLIEAVAGVQSVDKLQTRLFGDGIMVDVEIGVDAGLTVIESHEIAVRVHDILEGQPSYQIKHCNVLVNPINALLLKTKKEK